MVLKGMKGCALSIQQHLDFGVARQRLGLIVMIGKNSVSRELAHQQGQRIAGCRVLDNQAHVSDVVFFSQTAQLNIQVNQRLTYELNSPVCTGKAVQNLPVKDKNAKYLVARLQGVMQCGIVISAQVAPEPHQACLVFFVHDSDSNERVMKASGASSSVAPVRVK